MKKVLISALPDLVGLIDYNRVTLCF